MSKKLELLAERRQSLVAEAAIQRTVLVHNIEPLRRTLAVADRALTMVHYVKAHPILILGATTLFGILQPTRFGKWLSNGWVVFRLARNFGSWLAKR